MILTTIAIAGYFSHSNQLLRLLKANYYKCMKQVLFKYFDLTYFLKFISLFLLLYAFNGFYIGVTGAGGMFYSPFLNHHLNYVAWMRSSILHGANLLAHTFGTNSFIIPPYTLKILRGPSVMMGYSCIGFGNISFWLAFVVTHSSTTIKKKIKWCMAGVFVIWFVNCLRVTFLLMALKANTNINRFADHHTLYNTIAYTLIAAMVYLFTKKQHHQYAAATL